MSADLIAPVLPRATQPPLASIKSMLSTTALRRHSIAQPTSSSRTVSGFPPLSHPSHPTCRNNINNYSGTGSSAGRPMHHKSRSSSISTTLSLLPAVAAVVAVSTGSNMISRRAILEATTLTMPTSRKEERKQVFQLSTVTDQGYFIPPSSPVEKEFCESYFQPQRSLDEDHFETISRTPADRVQTFLSTESMISPHLFSAPSSSPSRIKRRSLPPHPHSHSSSSSSSSSRMSSLPSYTPRSTSMFATSLPTTSPLSSSLPPSHGPSSASPPLSSPQLSAAFIAAGVKGQQNGQPTMHTSALRGSVAPTSTVHSAAAKGNPPVHHSALTVSTAAARATCPMAVPVAVTEKSRQSIQDEGKPRPASLRPHRHSQSYNQGQGHGHPGHTNPANTLSTPPSSPPATPPSRYAFLTQKPTSSSSPPLRPTRVSRVRSISPSPQALPEAAISVSPQPILRESVREGDKDVRRSRTRAQMSLLMDMTPEEGPVTEESDLPPRFPTSPTSATEATDAEDSTSSLGSSRRSSLSRSGFLLPSPGTSPRHVSTLSQSLQHQQSHLEQQRRDLARVLGTRKNTRDLNSLASESPLLR